MVRVDQPVVEKLTFLWHNHFATAASKVRDATLMLGQKNLAGAPNENLSREFIELFTLGHGNGYTEQDVRDGARALTGWTITRGDAAARFVAARHDSGSKTVLGVTGNLDETGYCDAVLAQPATAEHVVTRLYGQIGSDQPVPAASVTGLADVFRSTWDISALVTSMMLSSDFVAAQGRLVIGPVEWLVGAVRALQVPVAADAGWIERHLTQCLQHDEKLLHDGVVGDRDMQRPNDARQPFHRADHQPALSGDEISHVERKTSARPVTLAAGTG